MMYKSQRKHRAMHCGYISKPSKTEIKSQLDFYKCVDFTFSEMKKNSEIDYKPGEQLKLEL